jgi:hypothetical protein
VGYLVINVSHPYYLNEQSKFGSLYHSIARIFFYILNFLVDPECSQAKISLTNNFSYHFTDFLVSFAKSVKNMFILRTRIQLQKNYECPAVTEFNSLTNAQKGERFILLKYKKKDFINFMVDDSTKEVNFYVFSMNVSDKHAELKLRLITWFLSSLSYFRRELTSLTFLACCFSATTLAWCWIIHSM